MKRCIFCDNYLWFWQAKTTQKDLHVKCYHEKIHLEHIGEYHVLTKKLFDINCNPFDSSTEPVTRKQYEAMKKRIKELEYWIQHA